MTMCVALRCSEQALASGRLCRRHQQRLDRGEGLPRRDEPVLGDPSGHGRYGVLDVDEYGVLCHECGHRFASLGIHAYRTHSISATEYRDRHGVEGSLALPKGSTPRRRARACPRCSRIVTTRRRTCDECWEARLRNRAEPRPRRPRWRKLTAEEAAQLRAADDNQLPVLVAALQADRVPSRQIGQVLSLRPQQMAVLYSRAEYRR